MLLLIGDLFLRKAKVTSWFSTDHLFHNKVLGWYIFLAFFFFKYGLIQCRVFGTFSEDQDVLSYTDPPA